MHRIYKKEGDITSILFIRTFLSYCLVVFALRILGKRQVGELQPSELVVAIMISDIASIPLSDSSLPMSSGIVPILTLMFAEVAMSVLALKFPKIRKLLTGTPAVIINKGTICREEMKKNRYNLEDLAEALRMKDYFSVDDVYMAILETNGSLSVIPKAESRPPTAEELGVKAEQETLPHVIIADGKKYTEHMKEAGVDDNWLKKAMNENGISKCENVFLLTVDANKEITIQKKE